MNKHITWAKSHKIAATLIGAGALIIGGFVLILTLGIVFVSTGMVEPEPVAQEAEPAKTEAKKAEKKTEPKTAEPAPKKTQEDAKAEPKPAETKAPAPKAETPKKDQTKPKADPMGDKLKAAQKNLNAWFESCEWQDDNFTSGSTKFVTSVCESEALGIVISESDVAVEGFLEGAAQEAPVGKYFIEESMGVFSPDGGTLNQAWDSLGAPGTPKDMADLAK